MTENELRTISTVILPVQVVRDIRFFPSFLVN